jgi:SAM-dependent methyltransferase
VAVTSGSSDHYAGGDYFGWQRRGGELGGRLNLWEFRPHVRPGDAVLDFGCGGGFLLENLEAAFKAGVEPGTAAAAEARRGGLTIYGSAAEAPSATFDVVISHHALEHTLSPLEELRELRRALKPAGKLVLVVPLDDWRSRRQRDLGLADRNHHLYAWTPLLLKNLLDEAGFEVADVRISDRSWPPKPSVLIRLPEHIFWALGYATAVARKKRQLIALATTPKTSPGRPTAAPSSERPPSLH